MRRQPYLERISLVEGDRPIFQEHLARYQFAIPWAGKKVVLDAATGTGYGAALLAQTARYVVGVDIAREAVVSGVRDFSRSNLHFAQMDCTCLGFGTGTFDLVYAFEMIEHIADYRRVLKEFRRVLRKGGRLILSTPNRRPDDPVPPANPYHVQEFSSEELETLLYEFFPKLELYGQGISPRVHAVRHGTPLKQRLRPLDPLGLRHLLPPSLHRGLHRLIRAPVPQDIRPSDFSITQEALDRAAHLIAVCVSE